MKRTTPRISYASYEQEPLRALEGPAGVEGRVAGDEPALLTMTTTEKRLSPKDRTDDLNSIVCGPETNPITRAQTKTLRGKSTYAPPL
jgi:hypothetical protein